MVGTPHHDIALLVGVSIKTLLRYYRKELDIGKARANANVAKGLYSSAIKGNLGAQIFWLKAQAGWREVPKDDDGSDGGGNAPVGKIIVEVVGARTSHDHDRTAG
jgi:hypothetical protein